jgi:acyl-CoA thioester hydrolase
MSGVPPLASACGEIVGGRHRLAVRIYFEDTDLSGLVYHANYLRYMERGRSDLLACLGIDQRAALEAGEGVYAVADLSIRYRVPARLGDLLMVETRCLAVGGASVTMGQRVLRAGTVLTDATVRAGFLTPDGRPRRQPAAWVERYRALLPEVGA